MRNLNIITFFLLFIPVLLFPIQANAQTPITLCKSSSWLVDKLDDQVRIFHQNGTAFPQYGALHLNDSYFRLNYGPGSEWGTSVILMPAFWSGGKYYQKTGISVSCTISNTNVVMTVKGSQLNLNTTAKVTVLNPATSSITAKVSASLTGTVPIDTRPGEAFKPVMLSSMHISDTQWDTKQACAGSTCFAIPKTGFIISTTQIINASAFRLVGGTSPWKTNAPTILINNLNTQRRIQGWVDGTKTSTNDDNVGFWAAADKLLTSWSYQIVAKKP